MLYRVAQKAKAPVIRRWYNLMSRIDRGEQMVFMNYGWASLDPEASPLGLQPEDEKDRYCIQLYDQVAGSVDLRRKDILEIGCGRGGGASWIMRYLQPRTLTWPRLLFERYRVLPAAPCNTGTLVRHRGRRGARVRT